MKKIALYTILTALILAGCAGQAQFAEVPPPMEEVASYGGGYDEEFIEEWEHVESGKSTGIANSTAVESVPRMVISNADLSIVVEDPIVKMDSIVEMADEMGGFVVSSNVWQTTLSNGVKVPHASITIRVPAERFEEALDRIKAGVGEVLSENVSGQDVTREYTDLQSRLRNLEAAETQLQEIMEEAKKTEDVLQVYNNLVNVREQIEVIKGQMQYYEQAAALSMISVDITGDEEAQPLQIGGWQPVGVAKDAIEAMVKTLQWLGDVAIWFVLCVLPIGIIVGIPLYFAVRYVLRIRKRRRAEKAGEEQDSTAPIEEPSEE
jgi:hypothetical protein